MNSNKHIPRVWLRVMKLMYNLRPIHKDPVSVVP